MYERNIVLLLKLNIFTFAVIDSRKPSLIRELTKVLGKNILKLIRINDSQNVGFLE